MISINGRTFRGNNVTIINGKVINEGDSIFFKKFDDRKEENAHNVEKITIDSSMADVDVSVSNSEKVEAHFFGEASVDGDVKFDVKRILNEIIITLDFSGTSFGDNLKLNVTIPAKEFKQISIKTNSGNVQLRENVATTGLKVKTQSGDVETNSIFRHATLKTMSGDVDIFINAISNVELDVSTMSGDIEVELQNIGYVNLSSITMSGTTKNRHNSTVGYTANFYLSTMSGDIKIR